MWGLRPALAKYGVTLTILENVETFGNLSGGVKQSLEPKGLTTVTLQMDTEKAFGLKGGTLNVSGLQVYGGELNADNLLVLQTVSDIDAPVGIRLWELWYQQKFGDKFDVKIGEQSLDEEFIIAPTGNSLFINGVSGWPGLPTVDLPGGGPVYPLAALGVRGRAQLTDSVTVLGGVFNGSPIPRDSPSTPTSNPHGVSFPLDVGTLAIAELQYAYGSSAQGKANADGPLPGIYKIGAWYDSYKFDDQQTDTIGLPLASPLSNGNPATHHGDFSLYGVDGSDDLAFEGQRQSQLECLLPSDVHAVPGSQPGQRQHQRWLRLARPIAWRATTTPSASKWGPCGRAAAHPPSTGKCNSSSLRSIRPSARARPFSRRPTSFRSCPRGRFSRTSSISSIRV